MSKVGACLPALYGKAGHPTNGFLRLSRGSLGHLASPPLAAAPHDDVSAEMPDPPARTAVRPTPTPMQSDEAYTSMTTRQGRRAFQTGRRHLTQPHAVGRAGGRTSGIGGFADRVGLDLDQHFGIDQPRHFDHRGCRPDSAKNLAVRCGRSIPSRGRCWSRRCASARRPSRLAPALDSACSMFLRVWRVWAAASPLLSGSAPGRSPSFQIRGRNCPTCTARE